MFARWLRVCLALWIWMLAGTARVPAQDAAAPAPAADAVAGSLTFLGWSDQHVQTDGRGEHLLPAIEAMNRLPGTAYPSAIGGTVAQPAFLFGCGDITEWPTQAAVKTYESLLTKHLQYPAFDVIGNHDAGGNSPSDTLKNWLIARHGALTYAFESHGIRFIALYSAYDESLNNPAQPLTRQSLDELRKKLAESDKSQPTIVATHLCLDALTNKDELIEVLAPFHVLAVLGGHYHKATVQEYRGRYFVQLPSPAPNGPRAFTVFRITPQRVVAIPYNYESKSWVTDKSQVLDVSARPAEPR